MKTYYLNTGVKPFDFSPPAGMAFMDGFEDSGNGVYVIPFDCEEAPSNFRPYKADNIFVEDTDDFICRKVLYSKVLKSKYVHFKKII